MTDKNTNNDVLRKMDSLLSLLVEHSSTHKNCCLKKIVGLALTSPLEKPSTHNNPPSFRKVDCI